MGYTGFGMRKEEYTRSANMVFSKLKTVYGDATKLPKSSLDTSNGVNISFEKHTYQPFHANKYYRVFKKVVFLAIVGLILWGLYT